MEECSSAPVIGITPQDCLFSKNLSVPEPGPSSQAVVLDELPFDCVTTATCGSWLNFPEGPGPSFFVLFKEKKKKCPGASVFSLS